MANEKISAMPAASAFTGPELIAMVQSGANVAGNATQMQTFARGTLNGTGNLVATTSASLVTPALGNATATSLTLGANSGNLGLLKLSGNTSGTVTIQTAAAAGNWTLTLPATAGTNLYVLQTDGNGNTTWVAQSGGGGNATPGGSTGDIQYNNAGAFGGSAATITSTGVATFPAAGAASAPSVSITGAPFTGGNATTNVPLLYLNDGAAPTTWSTAGTIIGVNSPSGFTGNYIDFRLNGSTSEFNVTSAGAVTAGAFSAFSASNSFVAPAGGSYAWSTRLSLGSPAANALQFGANGILSSSAAATWQFGAADAAAPIAQTLLVQSVSSGTSNVAGANLTIGGSKSTGNATGGSIIFQTSPAAGSGGTTVNALTTEVTINTTGTVIASGKTFTLGNAAVANLTAGVFAATTNATIVISDSTGQAYRIPCAI